RAPLHEARGQPVDQVDRAHDVRLRDRARDRDVPERGPQGSARGAAREAQARVLGEVGMSDWMQTAIGTADAVRRGEKSARESVEEALRRVAERNPALNAFVVLDGDLARKEADRVDALVARGSDPGPLAGVPFGVKDMDSCAGFPTSYGSALLKERCRTE